MLPFFLSRAPAGQWVLTAPIKRAGVALTVEQALSIMNAADFNSVTTTTRSKKRTPLALVAMKF